MLPLRFALAFALLATAARAGDDGFAHVSLREIRNNPEAFKNTHVAFKCRINKTENLYAPFHTAFSPEQYTQVSAWGPESKVFIATERLDLFPNLFLRKNREWHTDFLEVPRYSWMMVFGEVKSVFAGEPWIEVYDWDEMSDKHFTDASLGATIRAYEAFEKNDMEGVLTELACVEEYALPETDRYHVSVLRALAAWSVGRDAEAKRAAAVGLRVRPGDADLRAIAEGVKPRSLSGGGETPGKEGEPGVKEGEPGAKPEPPKTEEKTEPGEDEGEKDGSIEGMKRRLARLEGENSRLRRELEAAREEMALTQEKPKRVAEK